jgi:hypothetical protein
VTSFPQQFTVTKNELPGSQLPSAVRRRELLATPELDELLISDPLAVGFGDDVADHGDRCLKHGDSFHSSVSTGAVHAGTSVTPSLTATAQTPRPGRPPNPRPLWMN